MLWLHVPEGVTGAQHSAFEYPLMWCATAVTGCDMAGAMPHCCHLSVAFCAHRVHCTSVVACDYERVTGAQHCLNIYQCGVLTAVTGVLTAVTGVLTAVTGCHLSVTVCAHHVHCSCM